MRTAHYRPDPGPDPGPDAAPARSRSEHLRAVALQLELVGGQVVGAAARPDDPDGPLDRRPEFDLQLDQVVGHTAEQVVDCRVHVAAVHLAGDDAGRAANDEMLHHCLDVHWRTMTNLGSGCWNSARSGCEPTARVAVNAVRSLRWPIASAPFRHLAASPHLRISASPHLMDRSAAAGRPSRGDSSDRADSRRRSSFVGVAGRARTRRYACLWSHIVRSSARLRAHASANTAQVRSLDSIGGSRLLWRPR